MPTLTVLVGLPRSGKSTYAKQLRARTGAVIVNPDTVRLALHGKKFEPLAEDTVWANVRLMVRSLLMLDHDVIADATNVTAIRRKEWTPPAGLCGDLRIEYHEVLTDRMVCVERALVDGDVVLADVIQRMVRKYEPVSGVSNYYRVVPNSDFTFEVINVG